MSDAKIRSDLKEMNSKRANILKKEHEAKVPGVGALANEENFEFNNIPGEDFSRRSITVPYVQISDAKASTNLDLILDKTPNPKGRPAFSSVHFITKKPSTENADTYSDIMLNTLRLSCSERKMPFITHWLNLDLVQRSRGDPLVEYKTIFELASGLIMQGADRASLIVYIGSSDIAYDAFAALIGMLPFRGVSTALITQRQEYGDLTVYDLPSGVFSIQGTQAPRMGMFPISCVFGPLATTTVTSQVRTWEPISTAATIEGGEGQAIPLPFKIGGLVLPMLNHNAQYDTAVRALADTLERHYAAKQQTFFPIVSCGETVDAMGYGSDILDALTLDGKRTGYYFTHKSGETNKCYQNYTNPELYAQISSARKAGMTPLIIAVGGGVNGNSIGLVAAMTSSDFVEVPTTPMHFNDATTSAKKAFSLVQKEVILSKNILGAFYLPLLVFCVSEMILTISSANAHATVGEATKTMNMLGVATSAAGKREFHNILGAKEFASDFTKILKEVNGFDKFVRFIEHPRTLKRKAEIIALTKKINELRIVASEDFADDDAAFATVDDTLALKSHSFSNLADAEGVTAHLRRGGLRTNISMMNLSSEMRTSDSTASFSSLRSNGSLVSLASANTSGLNSLQGSAANLAALVDDMDLLEEDTLSPLPTLHEKKVLVPLSRLEVCLAERKQLMDAFRAAYYLEIPPVDQAAIKSFLTTINIEIVKAKAMFLAYSDPFEKYRALLFEYAHTLGHGIEAFANAVYSRAKKKRIPIPDEAFRLHGQCVGMAVLWAGAMSSTLGVLDGEGLQLHQSFVYLFNRNGGFSFRPLRTLCERVGVTREEMCEGVIRVVRRDNKRGYCKCSNKTASVDQLVTDRPGKMLRSRNPNAELRYLVEVPESLQIEMLEKAWEGDFDCVADLSRENQLVFRPEDCEDSFTQPSKNVGDFIHSEVARLYRIDSTPAPSAN